VITLGADSPHPKFVVLDVTLRRQRAKRRHAQSLMSM